MDCNRGPYLSFNVLSVMESATSYGMKGYGSDTLLGQGAAQVRLAGLCGVLLS